MGFTSLIHARIDAVTENIWLRVTNTRDADASRVDEHAVQEIFNGVAAGTREAFFDALVNHLARALKVLFRKRGNCLSTGERGTERP